MFRRRQIRKAGRALIDNENLTEFDQAHKLLAQGQPAKAAEIFSRLAAQTKIHGRPLQAGNLHAQAAHAWIDAGDEQRAMEQARHAMGLFNDLGITKRAVEFKTRFAQHLQECELQELAGAFEKEAGRILPPQIATDIEIKRAKLPAICPHCGAPVRGDRIEWIDQQSAVCDFCAATIHTMD